MNSSTQNVRWGLVGTGDLAGMIAPDFALASGTDLVGVSSRFEPNARRFASDHTIPRAYARVADMFADDEIDAVYVATPLATHSPIARNALEAGKHVLIEKPMAMDSQEIEQLRAIAAAQHLLVGEAMWMKFNPAIVEIQRLVAAGAIGQVRSIRASFGLPFPRDTGSRWSAELGGSVLLDQGTYPLTLAKLLLGEPESISADGTVDHNGVDLADHMTLEYSNGRFAQLAVSMTEYIDPTATINGTEGWISIAAPFWATRSFDVHAGPIPEALFRPDHHEVTIEGNGFVPMLAAYSAAILGGKLETVQHSIDDVLAIFATSQEIRDQMARGKGKPYDH